MNRIPGRTLFTGATGYLGQKLIRRFESPVVLSRDPVAARAVLGEVEIHAWVPDREPPPPAALAGVETVIHLAGEPIALGGRWTPEKKERIRNSRVAGTRHLVAALGALRAPPRTLVSASAIGFYGERGDELLTEASAPGSGFWPEVCRDWEAAAQEAERFGVRVVMPRIGLVFGGGGGFLEKTIRTFRSGLGGRIGNGRQYMSWIHLDDLLALFERSATDERLRGPVNAVAPGAVRNVDFTRALAKAVRRPAWLPMPRWLLQSALGEVADALVVSQHVVPSVALGAGFTFKFPELESALADVLASR